MLPEMYIPPPRNNPTIFDFSQLSSLKRDVQKGADAPLDKQKKVAQQFEALFIQQLLKQARKASATPGGLFESDQTRLAQSMSDEQLATQLADPGIGLARALLSQIRHGQTSVDDNANAAQGGGAPQGEAASPPELARSRLPQLRSRIGQEAGQTDPGQAGGEVASSISSLIALLTKNSVTAPIISAIRGAPDHIQSFVSEMSKAAKAAASESGVPAKLILSQAALESGWGKREIVGDDGQASHNLFGIKATGGWTGKVVNVLTTEYVDGAARKVVQPFRAYDSYADSFSDYARLIGQSARYSDVVDAPTAEEAAVRIQQAGYATDPSYADKLISIMGYFDAGKM